MEKKIWTKPMAVVEEFMPNEYVSLCYNIACDYGAMGGNSGYRDENNHSHTKKESGSGCGWAENQSIQHIGGSNFDATIKIVEVNNDTYGMLQCEFTEEDGTPIGDTMYHVADGTTIHWRTNVGFGGWTVWMYHKGTFVLDTAEYPNRS